MRTLVIFAFLAVAFSAAVAAPSAHQLQPVQTKVALKDIGEDLLIDLISLILGVDVRAIIAQTEATITGLEALLESSSAELEAILTIGGAELVAEAEAIIQNAITRTEEIVEPIVRIIKAIINLVGRRDLIGDLLKALLDRLVGLIDDTIQQLQDLAIETVTALQNLAVSAGEDIASQVAALLARTVSEGVALVEPLLELLQPLIPSGARLDLIGLIELITGIPIKAIIAQAEATAEGLAALIPATVANLEAALTNAAANLVAAAEAVITQAIADIKALVDRVIALVEKLSNGGNALILVPQLIVAVNNAIDQIPTIVKETAQNLVALVQSAAPDALADVQQVLANAAAEAEALIQPLLDLIAPLLPQPRRLNMEMKLIA